MPPLNFQEMANYWWGPAPVHPWEGQQHPWDNPTPEAEVPAPAEE